VHHIVTPVPREPGHLGEVVDHPGREDQAAAPGRATVGQVHPEAAVLADHRGDLTADHPAARPAGHRCPPAQPSWSAENRMTGRTLAGEDHRDGPMSSGAASGLTLHERHPPNNPRPALSTVQETP
jgi:hypothetical protein